MGYLEACIEAEDDSIFYDGYLWLDLTEKQYKKAYITCAACFGESWNRETGKYFIVLPSGITLKNIWVNKEFWETEDDGKNIE